jgi:nucleotide-binding universal stress UspA family protein
MPVRRVLCPIDFSAPAEAALTCAAELAAQLGAELHVMHTWQLSAYASPDDELAKDTQRTLEKELAATVARCVTNGIRPTTYCRLGPAPATILAAISELRIDHVVMGTTAKTGLERLIMGSVAEELVRHADVPVTTVRGRPKA